jgi:peptidoglycan hydrolase-like protein with peptidoglycan-binding domain
MEDKDMQLNKHLLRYASVVFLSALLVCVGVAQASAAESYTGKISNDKVFFRSKPNTDCVYLDKLDKGTKIAVFGIKGDFFAARYDGKQGYIMREFVNLSSGALRKLEKVNEIVSTSKWAKASSIRNLGEAPKYLSYGNAGEDVEKLQRALQLKKCYEGIVDGKFGNLTRDALKKYQKNNKLAVTGKADYDTIKDLFGHVSVTTAKDDPQMKGISSVRQINVPNTTEKNDSGKHVVALQQALKLKGCYSAPIDGKYGDMTVEAVAKFQKDRGLSADGIAGNATIKALFGKNAADYTIPTKRLDWFNGGQAVIPKGAIFTVKDVGTGKTFTMKRWSGANHVDAEPINSASSAAIKSAFGNAWSWARRPILVKYNGTVYAASMNGMPHGDNTISGNNFEGHVCIHFYGSKTHDTNRVDSAHQNAEARAMKASW